MIRQWEDCFSSHPLAAVVVVGAVVTLWRIARRWAA